MKPEQKIVAIGAASGVLVMVASVAVLTYVLPTPMITNTISDRLGYALYANVIAILPFIIMLIAVGNGRFFSDAIDPTRHAEDRAMEINGRVADNTLQQNFVFAIATLALATLVPMQYVQVVWALSIVFVVARCMFWLGYRTNPLYRAPGMAATSYMNVFIILYVLFRVFGAM